MAPWGLVHEILEELQEARDKYVPRLPLNMARMTIPGGQASHGFDCAEATRALCWRSRGLGAGATPRSLQGRLSCSRRRQDEFR